MGNEISSSELSSVADNNFECARLCASNMLVKHTIFDVSTKNPSRLDPNIDENTPKQPQSCKAVKESNCEKSVVDTTSFDRTKLWMNSIETGFVESGDAAGGSVQTNPSTMGANLR